MKSKVLIYIVTYNHENFILKVLKRIPKYLNNKYNLEILISDDKSKDDTLKVLKKSKKNFRKNFRIKIISTIKNLGYGGNQKIGYKYAIKNHFDYVVLLHGDGQYAPEYIDRLISKLIKTDCAAVFGSRMIMKWGALKGGMPLYKFIGNKILTYIQNKILSTNLSEFHSGYRAYNVETLKKISFNEQHFSTISAFTSEHYKSLYPDKTRRPNGPNGPIGWNECEYLTSDNEWISTANISDNGIIFLEK